MESSLSLSDNSTDYFELFKFTFREVGPINIVLSILIFLWNGLVISYYYKNSQKLTPALFFLLGISDVVTALGHLMFDVAAVVFIAKGEGRVTDEVMTACYVLYRFLAIIGFCSSIFLNAMLAVLRTVKIVAPFHRTNMKAVWATGAGWFSVIVILTLVDCVIAALRGWDVILMMRFAKRMDAMFAAINYPGQTISWLDGLWGDQESSRQNFEIFLLVLFYILPVVTVLVSTAVQVLKTSRVYRSGVGDEDTPLLTDWTYLNWTVVMLSCVFMVCNGASSVYAIYISGKRFCRHFRIHQVVLAVSSSTLPLFNCLISPLIIVTRSTSNLKVHLWRRLQYRSRMKSDRHPSRHPVPTECRFCKRKFCGNH